MPIFYVDADGKKQDAALHDEILADGDAARAIAVGREQARRAGLSADEIAALFDDDGRKDYDESQHPRDESGKWTSGGGEGGGSAKPTANKPRPDETNKLPPGKQSLINARFFQQNADDRAFPNLSPENFTAINVPTRKYNCAAYALGDTKHWVWPGGQGAWPSIGTDNDVDAFDELLIDALDGDEIRTSPLDDKKVEEGFVKIALYADEDGTPTHVARQASDGKWISKTGQDALIIHDDLSVLEEGVYGEVTKIYKVPEAEWRKLPKMIEEGLAEAIAEYERHG